MYKIVNCHQYCSMFLYTVIEKIEIFFLILYFNSNLRYNERKCIAYRYICMYETFETLLLIEKSIK